MFLIPSLIMVLVSCQKESDLMSENSANGKEVSSQQLDSRSKKIENLVVDPIFPLDQKQGKLENAHLVRESGYNDDAMPSIESFVWDLEAILNIDQFSPITQDRDRIVFSDVAYPVFLNKDGLISNPNQVMSEIRLDITEQVDKLLETSMLPSSFKWFEYVDVKLEIVDDENGVIYCGIGGGINYEYCGQYPCENGDLEYYNSVVGPTSFCDEPDGFMPISEEVGFITDCEPFTFLSSAATIARSYINRAVIVNGAYAPAPCNGIDPSIFSTDIEVPPSNLTERQYSGYAEGVLNPDWDGTSCYKEYLWVSMNSDFTDCTPYCQNNDGYCVPPDITQYFIDALPQSIPIVLQSDNTIPAGSKYRCIIFHYTIFDQPGQNGCGSSDLEPGVRIQFEL